MWLCKGVLFLALLAGSFTIEQSVSKARTSRGTVTLRLQGWVVSKSQVAIINDLVSQFQRKHRRIKVSYTPVQGDFEAELESQFLAHNAPDVFQVDGGWIRDFIQAGALQRLDPYAYADKSYHPNDFQLQLVTPLSRHGRAYAYPSAYSTLGLYYNRTRFRKLHIAHPPTDWKSFARLACAITNRKTHTYGAVLSSDTTRWFAFLKAFGGRVLNERGTSPAINSKQALAALKWYGGLLRKGCAIAPPSGSSDIEQFGTGRAAMMFEMSNAGQLLHTDYPHLLWGAAHVPTGPKGSSDLDYIQGYAMNAHGKQKAAAWKLISFLSGKAGSKFFDTSAAYLPPRRSIRPSRNLAPFLRGAGYASPWAWPPGLAVNAFPAISNDIVQVANHRMTYANALSDMSVWLKRYL